MPEADSLDNTINLVTKALANADAPYIVYGPDIIPSYPIQQMVNAASQQHHALVNTSFGNRQVAITELQHNLGQQRTIRRDVEINLGKSSNQGVVFTYSTQIVIDDPQGSSPQTKLHGGEEQTTLQIQELGIAIGGHKKYFNHPPMFYIEDTLGKQTPLTNEQLIKMMPDVWLGHIYRLVWDSQYYKSLAERHFKADYATAPRTNVKFSLPLGEFINKFRKNT